MKNTPIKIYCSRCDKINVPISLTDSWTGRDCNFCCPICQSDDFTEIAKKQHIRKQKLLRVLK